MFTKFNDWFDNLDGAYRPIWFMLIVFGWTIPNAVMIAIAGDTSKPIDMTLTVNKIMVIGCGIWFLVSIAFCAVRMARPEKRESNK